MAGSLKVKIGIAGFAVSILLGIPLLENSFFKPVSIKRWANLSWDDFQGIPQPFSSYEAAIASAVYLEYDSTRKRFHAYAGQHNVASWAKRSRPNQDYELNHEQYHFNITELHARKLNAYIAENPDGSEYLYNLRRGSINIDLRRMQRQYDNETNHSLISDRQRRWEYKIDSLLSLSKGWITDHFSGAQIYMTHPSDSTKGLIDGLPYRHYAQHKYGMIFTLTSYQAPNIGYRPVAESIKRNILNRSERLKLFSLDTAETFRAFTISEDSSNYTHYQLWANSDSYLYQLKTRYPNNTGDTTGYSQVASSFINSFRLIDTDSYWIDKMEKSDLPINFYNVSKVNKKKDENTRYCIGIGGSKPLGFYRGPFYRDDGAMVLAYDYLVHADTLHFKDVLLLREDWYSHTPTPEGQIYFIPANNIPKENFTIQFGYILKQDSIKNCYEFHHQSMEIASKINKPADKEF